MSYVVESGASSRARARRRRAAIIIVLLLLVLFLAFWYAYSYIRHSTPAAQVLPTCSPTTAAAKGGSKAGTVAGAPGTKGAPKTLAPKQITVNVYNATTRTGLAAKTAKAVRQRGFVVSTVTNDPLGRTVTAAAEVRYGKGGALAATEVAALVKGAKLVRDGRLDSTVDLVLGNGFTALAPARTAAPQNSTGRAC